MFVASKAKQYPYLAAYLQASAETYSINAGVVVTVVLASLLGVVGLFALFITPFANASPTVPIGMLLTSAAAILGASWVERRGRRKRDKMELEAQAVGERLRMTFDKKWFGRVRPNPTLMLLDECARHWARTKQALDSMPWRASTLPKHYATLRNQASQAADRAMCEAMVMAGPHLPQTPEKRDWSDMLEDVLQEVLKGPARPPAEPMPATFAPAREIAEKLRSLAQEVETLTTEVAREPAAEPALTAEHQLDLAIQDIRTVREAETELRQQTRG